MELQPVIDFLEECVNGRTLYTKPLVYQLQDGAMEGAYEDQISFSNLRYSRSGFQLDMFLVSNERIYYLGPDGMRKGLRRDFSGVSLFRFELARRHSTGEPTGIFRFLSASGRDIPAEAVVSAIDRVQLEDGTLTWRESQVLYRDQPATEGAHRPVAFDAVHRFSLEEGLLHYHYDGACLDVDPATGNRRPSADIFPAFHSAEHPGSRSQSQSL